MPCARAKAGGAAKNGGERIKNWSSHPRKNSTLSAILHGKIRLLVPRAASAGRLFFDTLNLTSDNPRAGRTPDNHRVQSTSARNPRFGPAAPFFSQNVPSRRARRRRVLVGRARQTVSGFFRIGGGEFYRSWGGRNCRGHGRPSGAVEFVHSSQFTTPVAEEYARRAVGLSPEKISAAEPFTSPAADRKRLKPR